MEKLLYASAIYDGKETEAVKNTLEGGWLSGGEQTARFEDELGEWWGLKALSCNSGSSANFLALQALDLPEGSEVITPAGGAFPTTISPMVYLHLKPVFIDVDLDTFCLDVKQLDCALSSKTKAIMFAHTLGQMPDMSELMTFAAYYQLPVIEDACDALGSRQDGKLAGTFGDMATCSFYPAHHITTGGEGGAVLTNNQTLYHRVQSTRDWGRDCVCRWGERQPACGDRFSNPPFDHRYYYTRLGMNLKLTEMQAAFGREQLKRLDGFIELRRRNYNILARALGRPETTELSPFAFPILARDKRKAMEYLEGQGIQTRAFFSGNILAHPAYRDIPHRVVGKLEHSQRMLNEAFFVGVGPHLTEENMNYIADKLKEI